MLETSKQISRPAILLTLALPFLLAAKPPEQTAQPTRQSLAGMYDGHQMEVAAQLVLKPDGHFQYELAYGAMDESAEGTWDIKPGVVLLTTLPAVKPPQFVVVSDTPEPRGGLWIKLVKPVIEGSRQRIYLFYGDEKQPSDMAEVADDGHVPLPGNRLPTAIMPEIPVYPIQPKPIPLTGTGGHRLTLRFDPNDIGKADFHPMPLIIENGVLVMTRPDLELKLHFKRADSQ